MAAGTSTRTKRHTTTYPAFSEIGRRRTHHDQQNLFCSRHILPALQELIENAVGPLNGVDSVKVAIDERTVAIDYDGTDGTFEVIVTGIEEQGYEVAG